MKLPILPLLALTTPILAQGDLLTLLRSDPDLSTLASLIQLTNLNTTLSTSNNITIVAPTNRAFSQVPRDIPEGVAIENRNSTAVSALLSNHVFQGLYPPSLIGDIPTFGQTLVNSTFFSDVQPFSGFTDGQYNGLVRNGEDVEILSGELSVSRVVEADIPLGPNILIHKIDTVLSFGPPLLLYLPRAGLRGASGAFSAINLGLNLGNEGAQQTGENVTDLTFFIPNDLAFENIGSVLGSVNESTLREVLGYHVLQDDVVFSTGFGNRSVMTAQGGELELSVLPDGETFVNGARVVFPNVILYNGVAHIIDQVLNPLAPPPSQASIDFAAPVADRVQFEGATSSSPLPFTSFSFSEEFEDPYTTAALLTTLQAVDPNITATPTMSDVATYTGGVERSYAIEVVAVVVAVAAAGAVLGGL